MQKLIVRTVVTVLTIQLLFLVNPSSAYAQEEDCHPTAVSIDVRPGDAANRINLSAKGLLPVAVLTTEGFDASLFAPEMAHLSDASLERHCAGAAAARWNHDDVNDDGRLDLVFFFPIKELNLTLSSTEVRLMAHGPYDSNVSDIMHIEGTDSIVVKR